MLKNIQRFVSELILVNKIIPSHLFFKWLSGVPANLSTILKTKSLGVLDDNFGNTFDVIWYNKKIHFDGLGFGVVREIYGHCCYAKKGELKNAKNILDLGGNGGAFTLFALTEAPNAKIHVVEALSDFVQILEKNVKQNQYEDRVTTECAVVGGFYDDFTKKLLETNPNYPVFSIHNYMSTIDQLDFLKCDVEGGEFYLMTGDLKWTEKVKKMVLEYHPTKGNIETLENTLKSLGFKVRKADHGCLGYFYCEKD